GELPRGLRRQFLAGPLRVGLRITIGYVNDRMIVESADRAARATGPAPAGAELEIPPLAPVTQVHGVLRRREDQRAGLEHVRQRAGIIVGVGLDLGEGDVAGRVDEVAELAVRHRRAVNPETVDGGAMDRRLFRIMLVRPHAERTTGYPDHVRKSRRSVRRA